MDDSQRKRTVSITMPRSLRAVLEQTAAATERSLSAEIEFQLEELALLRDLIPALRQPGRLLQMAIFLQAVDSIEEETGKPWDEDEGLARAVVARVVSAILDLKRNKAFDAHIAARSGSPINKTSEVSKPARNDEDPLSPIERAMLIHGKQAKRLAHQLIMSEAREYIRRISEKASTMDRTRPHSETAHLAFFRAPPRVRKN
jgi:hypothetical protein